MKKIVKLGFIYQRKSGNWKLRYLSCFYAAVEVILAARASYEVDAKLEYHFRVLKPMLVNFR